MLGKKEITFHREIPEIDAYNSRLWTNNEPGVLCLVSTFFFFYPWTSALQGLHPNCQTGHVYIFFRCVPSWVLCHFYPEKWIWVVVLWLREITDFWAPNHGRRPAAPQAIERLQTTGLSSKYIQWTGALPREGNQWNQWEKVLLKWYSSRLKVKLPVQKPH